MCSFLSIMHNLVQIVTADKKKRVQNWSRMAETATWVVWFSGLIPLSLKYCMRYATYAYNQLGK